MAFNPYGHKAAYNEMKHAMKEQKCHMKASKALAHGNIFKAVKMEVKAASEGMKKDMAHRQAVGAGPFDHMGGNRQVHYPVHHHQFISSSSNQGPHGLPASSGYPSQAYRPQQYPAATFPNPSPYPSAAFPSPASFPPASFPNQPHASFPSPSPYPPMGMHSQAPLYPSDASLYPQPVSYTPPTNHPPPAGWK